MSTWATRLSTAAKSASPSPSAESRGNRAALATPLSSSSCAISPLNVGPASAERTAAVAAGSGAVSASVREEFRRVAEKYNEESACMLRLPPDCWDLLTQYLSYMDVVALGQTCRALWVLLHSRDTVWWRQLRYFHNDVRDLRGGTLLCTAPLFPKPPADVALSQPDSMLPSPTALPTSTAMEGRLRSFNARRPNRRGRPAALSAYERFFQERRVYVLDAHREWHFQELADVEDKATGMFTVALHDGRVEAVPTPLAGDVPSLSLPSSATPPPVLLPRTTGSATATPVLMAADGPQEWEAGGPPSPISLAPSTRRAGSSLTQAPTPHRRITPIPTPINSVQNSPALAPAPAPPTPPLFPRVGDPIINDHNPLLRLRVYSVDVHGAQRELYGTDDEDSDGAVGRGGGGGGGSRARSRGQPSPSIEPALNLASMTEEQLMEYVMQLSLAEAHAAVENDNSPTAAATHVDPATPSPQRERGTPVQKPEARRSHYRGAPGAVSLPLSELLIVIDSMNNNALDQLQRHHVRDCTDDEDPKFLQRLAETLRSAKHRRLHLGNHHRAVRNNGQTTRNRAGRTVSGDGANASTFTVSATTAAAGVAGASPTPQPPPPMNRMLRGFHGQLLEVTEREARMVASKLLGKPNIIDDFVVFHCTDPTELQRCLYPSTAAAPDPADPPLVGAPTAARPSFEAGRQIVKHGMLVSVPAPLYPDTAEDQSRGGAVLLAPPVATDSDFSSPMSASPSSPACPSVSLQTVMPAPPLKPLPFFTRFFLAPELCHDGLMALIVVDVVRVLVVVDREVVSTDNPDWASPVIDRGGRVVVPGQGYNPQAYTRSDYNYVPPIPPRRRRDSN